MKDGQKKDKNLINKYIKPQQITKYTKGGKDFIEQSNIQQILEQASPPDTKQLEDILSKSLAVNTLTLEEAAVLLKVTDSQNLMQMQEAAAAVKRKVYDNRIVTFAPLYLGNHCVNDCLYCGFRRSNLKAKRVVLSKEQIVQEVKTLAGKIGHKRLIVVYGEHPLNDIDYIVDSIKTIYSVKEKTRFGTGEIRRVNVNAPPFAIEELRRLKEVGIGTYQVFQETYHRPAYHRVHPETTVKGDYGWRLYTMHRAMEAGIDDVGLGVLFGLYNWQYEVLGLLAHSRELEKKFSIGPHTISFPRLEPAANTPFTKNIPFKVGDSDFMKLITVLRLAVPYTGLIVTAREKAAIRRKSLALGVTQTDASTKIGLGAYSGKRKRQDRQGQQFIIGDTRSLEDVIKEFAELGYITSFCTAGYRCGRTGKCIMDLLRSGQEGRFCKLNAVLTFKEWLEDFASEETKQVGQKLINQEIAQIKEKMPQVFDKFYSYYQRISQGQRDLYF
jgi:2-iminoacetate synthase